MLLAVLLALLAAVVPNDNRIAAGKLSHGELHVSLDARTALWFPDGSNGVALPVETFAEREKPSQIPGPLIRVPRGTLVIAEVRNLLPATTLTLHGLVDRPAGTDRPIALRYGETRTVRFRAGAPGTYYYWGSTTKNGVGTRTGPDTQLSGAIVVDDPHSPWNARSDRIFVINEWDGVSTKKHQVDFDYEINAINGREYPKTEHLIYPVGSTVRWRIVNTSAQDHPLHLHGFYFDVDSRGNGLRDTVYSGTAYHDRRVTELVDSGSTASFSWHPTRPGNWLFHCHISYHTSEHAPFDKMSNAKYIDAYDSMPRMGGLILLVTVTPRPGSHAVAVEPAARHLTLYVEPSKSESPDVPAFRYVLEEGGLKTTSSTAMGPPIVLTRGEPVDLLVVNRLKEATAVHWHGIEQEDSYYDGVPGISGYGKRLEPMIMPGSSFDARFVPPRAGTFIYHTHMNDAIQSMGGLSGALIVLPPGKRFDPATDHIVEMSTPRNFDDFLGICVDGACKPPPMTLTAGVVHRFRFINMTMLEPRAIVSLVSRDGTALWTPIAVDAADLPASQRRAQPAIQSITIGQTRDFLFEPRAPGEYRMLFYSSPGHLRTTLLLHVTAATLSENTAR